MADMIKPAVPDCVAATVMDRPPANARKKPVFKGH
jgi:hypothetical protein